MKTFLAIYMGTAEARAAWDKLDEPERARRQDEGFKAWIAWGHEHASEIVDQGAPLGKTKRAGRDGTRDIKNPMTGYVIVKAETHEAATRLFENHPHFTLFPGDSVEIMEILPMPPG
jgi:hypothetical protein